jgi:anti-sigma regulatory factor (Ser/Thr protein kinase)
MAVGDGFATGALRWAQEYEASPATVVEVRRLARTALQETGAPQLPELDLVVTELAANAVRHANTPYRVAIEVRDDAVVVEVHDACERLPEKRNPQPTEPGGRGLLIVESVARRWGVRPAGGVGKTVWAELPLSRQMANA